jgi:hypothetical protein
MKIPTNEGGPNFEQSKLTGKYKRVRKEPPKPFSEASKKRQAALREIVRKTSDIEKVQASRLADMDYCYIMDPDGISDLLKVSRPHAVKLRKSASYKRRLWELKEAHNTGVEDKLMKDVERMKMRVASLVPQSIEVLASHLEGNDAQLRLQASREILDRDGRMPKTSRVQTQVQPISKIPAVNDATMEEFGIKPKPETVN